MQSAQLALTKSISARGQKRRGYAVLTEVGLSDLQSGRGVGLWRIAAVPADKRSCVLPYTFLCDAPSSLLKHPDEIRRLVQRSPI